MSRLVALGCARFGYWCAKATTAANRVRCSVTRNLGAVRAVRRTALLDRHFLAAKVGVKERSSLADLPTVSVKHILQCDSVAGVVELGAVRGAEFDKLVT